MTERAELRGGVDKSLLAMHPDIYMSMLETAEVVADRYGISREVMDEYGFQSQMRTAAAQEVVWREITMQWLAPGDRRSQVRAVRAAIRRPGHLGAKWHANDEPDSNHTAPPANSPPLTCFCLPLPCSCSPDADTCALGDPLPHLPRGTTAARYSAIFKKSRNRHLKATSRHSWASSKTGQPKHTHTHTQCEG